MANYTNIRPDTKSPFLVNGDDIGVIMHRYLDRSASTPTQTLAVYDRALGRQIWLDQDSHTLNTATIIAALKKNGTDLWAIPLAKADNVEFAMAYVNPKAFLALITGAAFTPKDADEDHAGVLLDVSGYGRLETHLPVRAINEFMAKIAAINSNLMPNLMPNLITVFPDTAKVRFVRPGYTVFDAAKVTSIRPNGHDMDVGLQDGLVGVSRLDFMMNTDGQDSSPNHSNYANTLWKRAERMKVKGLDDPITRAPILHEIFRRADQRTAQLRDQSKHDLAAAIGAKNPNLLKVENTKHPYYFAPAQISNLQCDDKNLYVQMRCADRDQYADSLTISFETQAMAQNEALRLLNAMNGGPAADINKPKLNLKSLRTHVDKNVPGPTSP